MKRGSLIGLLLAGAVGAQAGLPALLVEEGAPRGALIAGETLRCEMSELTALRAAVDARMPEAQEMARRFVTEHPTSAYLPEAMGLLTVAAFQNGDYAEAARTGRELAAAGLAPKDPRFAYARAVAAMQTGALSEAEPLFNTLRTSKKYGAAARFLLAYTAYAKGDMAAARSGFETILRGNKSNSDALSYLAQIDYAEADWRQAALHAEEALAKGVRQEFRPELQRVAGESLYSLGSYDEARPYLEEYLKNNAAPARTAVYDLGSIAYAKGDYNRAADLFEQLTAEGEPDALTQSAALYLGQCRMKQGDPSAAAIAFQTASRLEFDPKVTETAMYDYLAAAEQGGRIPFASSVTLMQQFADRFPASQYTADIQASLTSAYMRQHDYAAALKAARAITPATSQSRSLLCNVLYGYGLHSLRTGNAQQAVSLLREAEPLAATGDRGGVTLWLAEALAKTGDYQAAAAQYRRALQLLPSGQDAATARYGLANSLMQCDKYAEAAEQYAAVATDRHASAELKADALTRRADCMYLTRKPAAAIPLYKQAIQTDPAASGYARLRLARMYALTSQPGQSMAELDALLADASQQQYHPEATLQKGLAQIEAGKNADALATLESISTRWPSAPQNAEALLKSAILHRQLGHHDRAVSAYKHVIQRFGKTPQAFAAHQDMLALATADGTLPQYRQFLASVPGAPTLDADKMRQLTFDHAMDALAADAKATSEMTAYLRSYPDSPQTQAALLALAQAFAETGNNTEAIRYADTLLNTHDLTADYRAEALAVKAEALADNPTEQRVAYTELLATGSPAHTAGALRALIDMPGTAADRLAEYGDRLTRTARQGTDDAEAARYASAAGKADLKALEQMADPMTHYGALATVALGNRQIANGQAEKARKTLRTLVDSDTPFAHTLALGYIALADAEAALGNKSVARQYVTALRDNYPGTEPDIQQAIQSRLKTLK